MAYAVKTRLPAARGANGWSQEELARRAGISRAEVSAIETGRSVPSTAVALCIARALGRSVESLFALPEDASTDEWAWEPQAAAARYWLAAVEGRTLRYPVDASARATHPHDGVGGLGTGPADGTWGAAPERTIVVAGCDPAVGILAEALGRSRVRVLPFARTSRSALELLAAGRVHVAGVHLGESTGENLRAARALVGPRVRVVHVTRWTEGVALAPGLGIRSARAAVKARLRWVGREEGSGARACMDALLEGRAPPQGYRRTASDHHGVVQTIRTGWAQAGVCVQIAAEEGGLDFKPARSATYDLCFLPGSAEDPRVEALLDAVRSARFRRTLAELPGYDPSDAGALA